jgi:hypothetical protein
MTSATSSSSHSHPLDLIPLFRRWPGSPLRNFVYTALWNTLIALFLAGASLLSNSAGRGFLDHFGPLWLISNLVGYLIHGTLVGFNRLLGGWPSRARGVTKMLYNVVLMTSCVMLGVAIGSALLRAPAKVIQF